MKSLILKTTTIFLLSIITMISCFAQTKVEENKQDKLNQELQKIVAKYKTPGMAAVVVDKDQILAVAAHGKRKQGEATAIDLKDRFHIGSNTKAITGFLAGQLVSKGKIKWETKVLDLFPEWKATAKAVYHDVSLQKLLSHQARIQAFTSGLEFLAIPPFEGTNREKRNAFSKWLLALDPVEIDPEKGNSYSNAGYAIASAMMEKVMDKAWEDLLEEYIFKALDIKASYGWPAINDPAQPWGHLQGQAHDPNGDYHLGVLVAPAGDVSMSIEDYAKFLQEQLKGLAGEDHLLEAKLVDYLHHANQDNSDYGLGWGTATIKDKTVSYHDGSGGTFYCHAMILKKSGIAIAIMSNAADQDTVKGMYQLRMKLEELFVKS